MHRECRERFPCHRLQRKPIVNEPGMHHDTCGGREKGPGIPGTCATRNFRYMARGPCETTIMGNWSLPSTDFSLRIVVVFLMVMTSTNFGYYFNYLSCGSSVCILIVSNCTPRSSRTWAVPSVLCGELGAPTGCPIWEKNCHYCSCWGAFGQKKSSSTLTVLPILCSLSIRLIASKNCSKIRINWARVSRRKRQGHEHTHHISQASAMQQAQALGSDIGACVCVCRGEIVPVSPVPPVQEALILCSHDWNTCGY